MGVLQRASTSQLVDVAQWALQLTSDAAAPVVFFQTLLTPTVANGQAHIIPIPGHPNLMLFLGAGETVWKAFDHSDPTAPPKPLFDSNGVLTNEHGDIVGKILPSGRALLDLGQIFNLRDQPGLCPKPEPDKYGQGPGSASRLYEDFLKPLINPQAPTPPGLAYWLASPTATKGVVTFDDCQKGSGILFEFKSEGYGKMWANAEKSTFLPNVEADLLTQSENQLSAAGDRPVIYICGDENTATRIRDLFVRKDQGRERINFLVVPFVKAH